MGARYLNNQINDTRWSPQISYGWIVMLTVVIQLFILILLQSQGRWEWWLQWEIQERTVIVMKIKRKLILYLISCPSIRVACHIWLPRCRCPFFPQFDPFWWWTGSYFVDRVLLQFQGSITCSKWLIFI